MSSPPARQPRGIPAGGRFTTTRRQEADSDVLDTEAKWVDNATTSCEYLAVRYGIEKDDLLQETVVEVWTALRHREATSNGEAPEIANPAGYVHTVARRVAERIATGLVRGVDRSAFAEYKQALDDRRLALDRPLTGKERNEIEENIRLSRRPGSRPASELTKFILSLSPGSLTSSGDDTHQIEVPDYDYTPGNTDFFADGTMGREAELDIESGSGRVGYMAARRVLWAALSESLGDVPQPVAEKLKIRAVTKARTEIRRHGGVAKTVAKWQSGKLSKAGHAALFAPFPEDLTKDQQRKVVGLLDSQPTYEEEIWQAALSASTLSSTKRK